MKGGDHGDAVRRRFVKGEIFGAHPAFRRRFEQLIDEGVAQLMCEHVEIKAERLRVLRSRACKTGFNEAVARVGIVPFDERHELESRLVFLEVPWYGAAEVLFPDVEDEPHGAIHVGSHELAAPGIREGIEVAVGSRLNWPKFRASPWS